jgi:hypothetical protein
MSRKYFKISILILISIVISILNFQKSKSCSFDYEPDNYYTIFDTTLFRLPDLKPLFLSESIFADHDDDKGSLGLTFYNLKEWQSFFNNIPALNDIDTIIYSAGLQDAENISRFITTNNKDYIPERYKKNTLVKYLKDNNNFEVINYLVYAKECEPHVSNYYYWDEPQRDFVRMNELIKKGLEVYPNIKSGFIKDRYAFQVIRLAHYSKQHQLVIDLYDKLFTGTSIESLIGYWSLEHKGGALRSLGKAAESNLIFAHVFDKCLSRRKNCILSIKLNSDSIITETFKLCKTQNDKIIINTLTAYINTDYSLEAMNNIYKLEPRSPYLELLLEREISRVEREVLPSKDYYWDGYKSYLDENSDIQKELNNRLYNIVSGIASGKKVKNPCLWNFAAGYLATLNNNTEEAKNFYKAAKIDCPKEDTLFHKKIQIAEFITKINSLEKIDKNAEANLLNDLKWLYNNTYIVKLHSLDALVHVMNTLAKKYWKQGDTIKTHLCLGIKIDTPPNDYFYSSDPFSYDIQSNYYLEPIDKIYNLLLLNRDSGSLAKDKSTLTEFDKFLIDNYKYSIYNIEDIIVRRFIAKGLFKQALEMIDKAGDDYTETLPADPFVIHIRDCHDCDFKSKNHDEYTLKAFCRKMAALEKLTISDKKNSAKYLFLMGNGHYNKSFYGNCWSASSYDRNFNYGSFLDCSKAKEYYLKAANITSDRNFAAKCLFMASKCEQNEYYNSKEPGDGLNIPLKFRTIFKKLKIEYSDTKYYKEIINECKYFSNYLSSKEE